MTRFADLHLHTYHSDGTRSPREVIDLARERGLDIVAISDHDNIAAYFEVKRYADERNVVLIPATEQWRSSYVVLTPDKYAFDFLVVTAPNNAQVDHPPMLFVFALDGMAEMPAPAPPPPPPPAPGAAPTPAPPAPEQKN